MGRIAQLLFWFDYLFWQPLAAYFLVKFPARWHLASVVFIWGGLLGCTTGCHNFAGLVVCRFLLGCESLTFTLLFCRSPLPSPSLMLDLIDLIPLQAPSLRWC